MTHRLLAYLRLLRLPAVFTAMADIFLGFLLTHSSLEPFLSFGMLLLASSSLYLSGMVFNDVFDRHVDARERPSRPIPSGDITLSSAITLGGLLMLAGLAAASVCGTNSLVVAGILTLSILAYDGFLKNTPFGPLAMGACRFLNVMLGASALATPSALWDLPQLHVAAGLGIYIVGVTWFARQEAQQSQRAQLLGGMAVVNLGIAVLVAFILQGDGHNQLMVLFVIGIIGLTINRRLAAALLNPVPQKVQLAIRTMLLSLVMLDATLVLFATGDATNAIATASLLVPAIALGRWISVT